VAINPLGAIGPGSVGGASNTTGVAKGFGQVLKGQLSETAPIPVLSGTARAAPGPCLVAGPGPGAGAPLPRLPGALTLDRLQSAQHRMDEVLRLAESGKTFSPAELLALQAHVYRASQQLDLAGKVVDKATGGVKQVLQTQV
jgi:hypothetical protein